MDGTFNQTRPLDLLVGKEVLFSYDLSSSTDRRPLEIMEGITTLLFVPSFAHARVRAALGCNYFPGTLLL